MPHSRDRIFDAVTVSSGQCYVYPTVMEPALLKGVLFLNSGAIVTPTSVWAAVWDETFILKGQSLDLGASTSWGGATLKDFIFTAPAAITTGRCYVGLYQAATTPATIHGNISGFETGQMPSRLGLGTTRIIRFAPVGGVPPTVLTPSTPSDNIACWNCVHE